MVGGSAENLPVDGVDGREVHVQDDLPVDVIVLINLVIFIGRRRVEIHVIKDVKASHRGLGGERLRVIVYKISVEAGIVSGRDVVEHSCWYNDELPFLCSSNNN
jgi:hypothetical protein